MKPEVKKNNVLGIKKIALYLLLAILVILIGGNLYLKSYFNSDKLKEMIVPKLEQNLQREVSIEGISLKFLSGFGLRIDGFKILNSGDFNEKYFAQFDTFNLDLALLPLLHKEIKIKEINLIKPIISLEVAESGETNYQFGTEQKNTGNKSRKTDKMAMNLNLNQLKIVDGKINYLNESSNLDIKLDDVDSQFSLLLDGRDEKLVTVGESQIANIAILGGNNLQFKDLNFKLEHQLNLDLAKRSFDFEKLNLGLGKLDISSHMNLIVGEDRLQVDDFTAKLGNSNIGIKGDLIDFSDPKLDLDLKSDLKLKELMAKLPLDLDWDLAGQFRADISTKNIRLKELKGHIEDINLKGRLEFVDINLDSNELPAELQEVNGQLKVSDKELRVDSFVVGLAEDRIKGKLLVEDWKKIINNIINHQDDLGGNIALDIAADTLNLDKIIISDNSVKTDDKKDKTRDNKGFYLPQFDLIAKLHINKLSYHRAQYQNIDGELDIADSKIRVEKLAVNKDDSRITVDGSVDYQEFAQSGDINQLDIDLNLDSDLDLSIVKEEIERFNPEFTDYNFAGRLKTDLRAAFELKDITKEALNNLDQIKLLGDIKFRGESIKLPQLTQKLEGLAGRVIFNKKSLELLDGSLNLAESDLTMKAFIADWRELLWALKEESKSDVLVDLELDSNTLAIDEILSLLATKEKVEKKGSTEKKDLVELIPNLKIRSKVSINQLKYQELKVEDVALEGGLKNKTIAIDNFKTKIQEGSIKSKGKIDLAKSKPSYQGNLKVDNIEVNQILSLFTDFDDKLYGKINLDTEFNGDGAELDKILESATLQGDVLISKGELKNFILIDKLSSLFNIFEDNKLDFKDLNGRIDLKGGKLYLKAFNSKTEFGEIKLAGYSTLKGGLNYKVTYLLSEEESKKLNLQKKELFYAPKSKRIQLDFKLRGDVNRPELSWDKSIVEERAKSKLEENVNKKLEEGKDKIKEELEKKKDAIKNIFKGLF